MGLLINTDFETNEGIHVTSVYGRVVMLQTWFEGQNVSLRIKLETYVNREKRLSGRAPIKVPGLVEIIAAPFVSSTDAWSSMGFLYNIVKTRLESDGFVVQDVFEDEIAPTQDEDVGGGAVDETS